MLTLNSLIASEAELWAGVQVTHTQRESVSFHSGLSLNCGDYRSQYVDLRGPWNKEKPLMSAYWDNKT